MEKFHEELVKAGVMLAGGRLQASSKGARVRFDGAMRTVIDGPVTEAKDLIAGYWLADAIEGGGDRMAQARSLQGGRRGDPPDVRGRGLLIDRPEADGRPRADNLTTASTGRSSKARLAPRYGALPGRRCSRTSSRACRASSTMPWLATSSATPPTPPSASAGRSSSSSSSSAYAVYIGPPLGRVGKTETESRASGRPLLIGRRPMSRVARAIEKGDIRGLMKVVVDRQTHKVLGAAIVGAGGDEATHGILDVMNAGVPYDVLRSAVPIHPTVSELIPRMLGEMEAS